MASEEGDDEGNSGPKRGQRQPLSRTLFIKVDDLDLDTPEGQDIMLKRMQILLATEDHNALDLNAFKILKDSVKVKTDLNVWKAFAQMQKSMKEWEETRKNA